MFSDQPLHPILVQMHPCSEQIDAILSRGEDVAVSAGAGTGKTRTLVARFLSLLAEGVPLRSIAAITFTKKAAREMRNRIREEIRRYLLSDPADDEWEVWADLYEQLDAARISTIHSLAAEILRHHPAELGLDPAFELLEESLTAQLKAEAVEAALGWAADDPGAATLFPAIGDWSLKLLLGNLLNKQLEVKQALEAAPENLWESWKPHLLDPLKEFINDSDVQAGLDELVLLDVEGILDQAESSGDALVEDLRIVINEWREIRKHLVSDSWIEISRRAGKLRAHLKQKGKGDNWSPKNPKPIVKFLQTRFDEVLGKKAIDLGIDMRLAREIIPQLGILFAYAEGWYGSRKKELNGLDFDDLEEKILFLFREHPAAASYWREQVLHLLVDEYQDTNQRQRQLVNQLCGNTDNLFIVGDGKQSIYRFRGADVSVFREEQDRIRTTGKYCQLKTSYRAHPELVSGLNYLLGPILGDGEDLPYREPFSALLPGRTEPPRLALDSFIEIHLAAGTKSDGAGRIAAEAVAARLQELIEASSGPEDGNGLEYGDVAVLCRASSSFADFEEAFEKAGIPYLTIAGQGFFDRPEIRDVFTALAVFLDPADDLAAAGLMRSPVVGIPDDLLLEIRDFQHDMGYPSLIQAAENYASRNTRPENRKAGYFTELVRDFSALAERIPAGALISEYINAAGYLPALVLAGEQRGIQNLKKLIADAQNSGIVGLRDYLRAVKDLREVAVREGEAPSVAEGAVQIMTVHQAKGLEFPVVVLGDASKREPAVRGVLLDSEFGLVLPFTARTISEDAAGSPQVVSAGSLAYDLALEREKPKEEAESDRLLYVAATRAMDILLISGVAGKPTKSGKLPSQPGWLGKILQVLEADNIDLEINLEGTAIHHQTIQFSELQAGLSVYEGGVEFSYLPTAQDWKEGDLPEEELEFKELDIEGQCREALLENLPQVYRASGARAGVPARIIGEVVHEALEIWIFPSGGEADFIAWAESALNRKGIFNLKAVQSGSRRVRKLLTRFQEHELYRKMASADLLWHEIPYSIFSESGVFQQGLIDALFVEDGSWHLVEFKTDRIDSEDQYQAIWTEKDYQGQVDQYLSAAEKLLGIRPRPIICFLNYQGRVRLETGRW